MKLTVEVWSDIACPWCWVGKRRLEAALAKFEHAKDTQVIWRAYELDPSAPALRKEDYVQRLADKYGRSRADAQKTLIDRMVDTGKTEGLKFDFEQIQSGNTFLGHRLLHLGHERGLQDAVKERMFRGYFSEGAAVGVPEVAAKLAIDAGLDPDEVAGVIQSDQFEDAVRKDLREAREIGVDGVPFFLFGRKYAVGGAQPPELLLKALQQTWSELPQRLDVEEGAVCGPEGC
ncbi:MAG: DsbA family oxidoreductase [Polyangiales bacterium]